MTTDVREFLKEEFQLRRLGFVDCDATVFRRLKWTDRLSIVLLYRISVAVYSVGWFLADIILNRDPFYYAFLTHWGEFIMCLYFIIAIFNTVRPSTAGFFNPLPIRSPPNSPPLGGVRNRSENQQNPPENPPVSHEPLDLYWTHKVTWVLFNLYGDLAPFISILYWIGVTHGLVGATPSTLAINVHVHAINSVLLLAELALNDLPIRVLHFYFSLIFGLVFIFFTLILHWAGVMSAVYPVLDWSSDPGSAVGFAVAALASCSLLSHAVVFALYAAKTLLCRRYYLAREPPVVITQIIAPPQVGVKQQEKAEKTIRIELTSL